MAQEFKWTRPFPIFSRLKIRLIIALKYDTLNSPYFTDKKTKSQNIDILFDHEILFVKSGETFLYHVVSSSNCLIIYLPLLFKKAKESRAIIKIRKNHKLENSNHEKRLFFETIVTERRKKRKNNFI
ncbi:hypothetical protein BpHYR1_000589 [Brachionus plicatilis]|uniref:Uncharacterized protein n=1 Tax=Brachionus plicatilis TaxID=10195 RepID=A0A3M7QQU6_BRAPC|nr:hypothetical protein BpHYR1_000589 [Brachionus plicatilis]